MQGIYKIENLYNHKVYIGQSVDLERRLNSHKGGLRDNCHKNKHLQNSWNKYGEENFEFSILEECSEDMLTCREQYWIDYYGGLDSSKTYNKRDAGSKGHLSEESKRKVSLHNKGKKVIITEDTKLKISQKLKGRPAHNKGKKASLETRQKISKALKGKIHPPVTQETRDKISAAHKGKPTWNKGIPNKYKGVPRSEEFKLSARTYHAKYHGYKVNQYDLNHNLIKTYESTMEAQRQTGVTNSGIGACCRGLQKTAGGYIWEKYSE